MLLSQVSYVRAEMNCQQECRLHTWLHNAQTHLTFVKIFYGLADLFQILQDAKCNQAETNSDPDLDVSSHSPCTTPWDWRKLMAGYRGGRSSEVQDGRQLITWVGEQLKKKGRLYLLKYQIQTF